MRSPRRWALVVVGALAACTHASAPPAQPPAVVAGPPSRFDAIVVAVPGGRQAAVPSGLWAGLAPLLTARDFGPRTNLADYGLDRPEASLTYRQGAAVVATVSIGSPDFDRRGFYAMRAGDPAVDLVLSDPIRPVLALVGIVVAPPA
jgi:hypothetical protein